MTVYFCFVCEHNIKYTILDSSYGEKLDTRFVQKCRFACDQHECVKTYNTYRFREDLIN